MLKAAISNRYFYFLVLLLNVFTHVNADCIHSNFINHSVSNNLSSTKKFSNQNEPYFSFCAHEHNKENGVLAEVVEAEEVIEETISNNKLQNLGFLNKESSNIKILERTFLNFQKQKYFYTNKPKSSRLHLLFQVFII